MKNVLRSAMAICGAVIALAAVTVSPAATQPSPCTGCKLTAAGTIWVCGPTSYGVSDPHFCAAYGWACELLDVPDCGSDDTYAADGSIVGETAADHYTLLPGEEVIVVDTRERLASDLQPVASRRACDGVIIARATEERAAENARQLTKALTI